MKGKIILLNKTSSSNNKSTFFDSDEERMNIYMGPERRNERRRERKSDRLETMIKNFGLERRVRSERRKEGTSWLLTSKEVVNQ